MTTLMPLALVRKIDYALLDPVLAREEIEAGCAAAVQYDCYSVIVKPHYVEFARKLLKDTGVKVASVVGFPHGGVTTASKMYETQDMVQRGADELYMALNIGALRDREDLLVHNDISTVVRTARGRPVTLVLECALLDDEEKQRACKIADAAGAAFVQTSTGFGPGETTLDDVYCLRDCPRVQIKAAGGIDSLKTAREMLEAGAARVIIAEELERIASGAT
jgi:deoxyribose-phosphate aldolase